MVMTFLAAKCDASYTEEQRSVCMWRRLGGVYKEEVSSSLPLCHV